MTERWGPKAPLSGSLLAAAVIVSLCHAEAFCLASGQVVTNARRAQRKKRRGFSARSTKKRKKD
ncbi:MAG: hypothetical protein U0174_08950 [Polyangiaceae bacterium]